jgi:hypothetical protein
MARKRHTPDEIAAKLRQVDVLVAQGQDGVDNSGNSSRRMMSLRIFAEVCLKKRSLCEIELSRFSA